MAVVNTVLPVISGQAMQGKTLDTTTGTWTYDEDFISYAYRWLRCDAAGANCVAIAGKTSPLLVLAAADVGSRIRSEVTATETSVPPEPPPPPGPWSGPITISAGGTYNGSWESTSSYPAVTITTADPVTINGRIRNLAGGDLIRGSGYVINDLTLENCFLYGGSGRVMDAIGITNLTVRNCTIDKTSGMKLSECSGAQILLTRNKHRNIQGPGLGGAALSQFSQLAEVQGGLTEISWNEVINDPELSLSEDILSVYKSSNVNAHDNYFEGQWTLGNSTSSSQNGMTIEEGEGSPPASDNNLFEDNQLVACMGGIGCFAGDNTTILNNRIVRSGYYPNGVTRVNVGYSGLDIQNGAGVNNHAHGNLVGYVSGDIHGFTRTDWQVLPAHCDPLNTHFPGTVTRQSEIDEYNLWLAKLVSNGITIGA